MACLRREALEGRGRAFRCGEEDCELRLKSFAGVGIIDDDPSAPDCVLQLRLRTGDAEGFGKPTERELTHYPEVTVAKEQLESSPGPSGYQVYLDEYRRWIGSWERVGDVVLHEDQLGVYAEGMFADIEWNDNSFKFLAEKYPPTIESFSFGFNPHSTKVPVDFLRHGPDPDTRGYRLLEEWEDDFDVPTHVVDAFREYLETGE